MLGGEYDVVYPYRFGNHAQRKVNMPFTVATQEDMDGVILILYFKTLFYIS